jgi:pimeloyl-ACP methyl ester carboxylesterase
MTAARMEIVHRAVGGGRVQATLNAAARPTAALLVLPPFFHEWQRSYRLFALLADALATRAVDVLRFDYRGTGESSGEDAAFLPSRALADAEAMLALLRERGDAPVTVLGIRGGALLAERLAERHGLPWWAWQAVEDGGAHLAELRVRDDHERNNRNRFPFLGRRRAPSPDTLMGHRLHPEFALELGIFKRGSTPTWCIDSAERCGPGSLPLPAEFSAWVGQIDLQGALPLAGVVRLAEQIATQLRAPHEAAA